VGQVGSLDCPRYLNHVDASLGSVSGLYAPELLVRIVAVGQIGGATQVMLQIGSALGQVARSSGRDTDYSLFFSRAANAVTCQPVPANPVDTSLTNDH
jgi:hypothetical protein